MKEIQGMTERDKGLKEGEEEGRERELVEGGRKGQNRQRESEGRWEWQIETVVYKKERRHTERRTEIKISIRLKTFFKGFKIDHVIILPSLVEI